MKWFYSPLRKGKNLVFLLSILLFVFISFTSIALAASTVKITKFHYNAAGTDSSKNVNDEYVVIQNISGKTLTTSGWLVKDKQNHRYLFPTFKLGKGAKVTLHTGKGTNNSRNLYMNRSAHIWNNTHDTLYLYNKGRKLILKKSY